MWTLLWIFATDKLKNRLDFIKNSILIGKYKEKLYKASLFKV